MEEILESLLAEAGKRLGAERAAGLRPTLEATAAELAALREYPLEPDDVP